MSEGNFFAKKFPSGSLPKTPNYVRFAVGVCLGRSYANDLVAFSLNEDNNWKKRKQKKKKVSNSGSN
jgi:hypothetical protein